MEVSQRSMTHALERVRVLIYMEMSLFILDLVPGHTAAEKYVESSQRPPTHAPEIKRAAI